MSVRYSTSSTSAIAPQPPTVISTTNASQIPPRSLRVYAQPPHVYSIGKYFLGKLKEFPVPEPIGAEFYAEGGVQDQLESILQEVTRTLPGIAGVAARVCMAGQKCCGILDISPCPDCKQNYVILSPTIWMSCGSRKGKKYVSKHFADQPLPSLSHFLSKHHMNPPRISRELVLPTAQGNSEDLLFTKDEITSIELEIRVHTSAATLCGSRIRFTIRKARDSVERFATLGGVVVADNRLYGLTTAHPVMNEYFEMRDSDGDTDSEFDSGFDSESDSDSGPDLNSNFAGDTNTLVKTEANPASQASSSISNVRWRDLPNPRILAYLGLGTKKGDWNFPERVPGTSDFALVDLDDIQDFPDMVLNEYCQTPGAPRERVVDHIPDAELFEGEIHILDQSTTPLREGYLLPGSTSVILRGKIMKTRMIQIESVAEPGLSGSWVIRNRAFCGVVYAAHDKSPYIHMLSAETVFENLKEVLNVSELRVALPSDVESLLANRAKQLHSFEGGIRSFSGITPPFQASQTQAALFPQIKHVSQESRHPAITFRELVKPTEDDDSESPRTTWYDPTGDIETASEQLPETSKYMQLLQQSRNLWPTDAAPEQNWSGRGEHLELTTKDKGFLDQTLETQGILGQGSMSRVERVKCRRILLARKTIRGSRHISKSETLDWVMLLKSLSHAHIVRVIGTYVLGQDISVLLYPVARYNLGHFMEAMNETATDARENMRSSCRNFYSCLSSATLYIHSRLVRHNDIKPSNILVYANNNGASEPYTVLLSGFGSARSYQKLNDTDSDGPFNTLMYAAPEVLRQDKRGLPADVFSLGCVFLEMFGHIGDKTTSKRFQNVLHAVLKDTKVHWTYGAKDQSFRERLFKVFTPEVPNSDIVKIIVKMMDLESSGRPTAKDLVAFFPERPCCTTGAPQLQAMAEEESDTTTR